MQRRAIAILTAILSVLSVSAGALEAPKKYRSDYTLTLFGLPIAKSRFVTTFKGPDFSIEGTMTSSGIARLFDRTRANTHVSGQLGTAPEPQSYALNYTSGGKAKSTVLAFSSGAVVRMENSPPLGSRRSSWIPVSEADLKSVTDPLSAAVVRASGLRNVCNRTLRVFDGQTRADLKLTYAGIIPTTTGIKPFSTGGSRRNAVRCRTRFIPVSGYHSDRKAIDYLSNRSRIEISFAQIGRSGIYAPVTASVKTQVGTVRVFARRFAVPE